MCQTRSWYNVGWGHSRPLFFSHCFARSNAVVHPPTHPPPATDFLPMADEQVRESPKDEVSFFHKSSVKLADIFWRESVSFFPRVLIVFVQCFLSSTRLEAPPIECEMARSQPKMMIVNEGQCTGRCGAIKLEAPSFPFSGCLFLSPPPTPFSFWDWRSEFLGGVRPLRCSLGWTNFFPLHRPYVPSPLTARRRWCWFAQSSHGRAKTEE